MTFKKSASLVGLLTIALLIFAVVPVANALSILAGSDYLTTLPGTQFDFGGPVGLVPMIGAFGLGVADTIVTRLNNATLPAIGSSDTIPIQLRLLELRSIAPVNVGGSFFDVFVHLDPGVVSRGTMTITHDLADNGTPAAEGTFTSNMVVNFQADFVPVGPGSAFSVNDSLALETTPPASWSHEPPPGVLLVTGSPGDRAANTHIPLPSGFNDFFPLGSGLPGFPENAFKEDHPGEGVHVATLALQQCPGCPNVPPLQPIVPEPGTTYVLLASGLGLLTWLRARARNL